jgi:hypothetical protein
MRRIGLIMFSFLFVLGLILINIACADDAAPDPFAGTDSGASQQAAPDPLAGTDSGASQQAAPDPFAGTDSGASQQAAPDPLAGMDSGAPQGSSQVSADTGAPPDAGAPPDYGAQAAGAQPEGALPDAGTPPDTGAVPGMEAGAPGSSPDNALLPDMQGQAAGNQAAEPGAGPDMGLPGELPQVEAGPAGAPATQPAPGVNKTVKKVIPNLKGLPKTNDIYTKTSFIGGYRFMHDFMRWGLSASSKLSAENDVSKLDDNNVDTAWVERKKDGGKNQSITFKFSEKYFMGLYEKKYRQAIIGKIKVLNGYAKDRVTWEKYYRVSKMKITKNKRAVCYIQLHDTMNWQTFTLKNPIIIKPGDAIKAQILEVFPDVRRGNDTYAAITEFTFLGGPYGPKVESKYIEAHMQ